MLPLLDALAGVTRCVARLHAPTNTKGKAESGSHITLRKEWSSNTRRERCDIMRLVPKLDESQAIIAGFTIGLRKPHAGRKSMGGKNKPVAVAPEPEMSS